MGEKKRRVKISVGGDFSATGSPETVEKGTERRGGHHSPSRGKQKVTNGKTREPLEKGEPPKVKHTRSIPHAKKRGEEPPMRDRVEQERKPHRCVDHRVTERNCMKVDFCTEKMTGSVLKEGVSEKKTLITVDTRTRPPQQDAFGGLEGGGEGKGRRPTKAMRDQDLPALASTAQKKDQRGLL